MTLKIYQVDAFSNGPFTGNPAAVVPLVEWLTDQQMQQIAMENNLSETAFFVANEDGYNIRWFTPAVEVALCGHATLAAAYVLFNHLGFKGDVVHFICKSGPISVSIKNDILTLDFPTDQLVQLSHFSKDLEKGLGILPTEVWQGRDDLLCIVESQDQLEALRPNFSILKSIEGRGVIVSAKGDKQFDFVSRGFFPQSGINEDPATGSAHTTLTPYWSSKLGMSHMSACQLSARRGYFHCQYNGERTLISGKADLYLKGEIYL